MVVEIVVSILAISFTSLGVSVYCHWKKLQRQEKKLDEISQIIVMIVDELNTETRERSGLHPYDQI